MPSLKEIPEGTLFWGRDDELHFLKQLCSLTGCVWAPMFRILGDYVEWVPYTIDDDANGEFTPVSPDDWNHVERSKSLSVAYAANANNPLILQAIPERPRPQPKPSKDMLARYIDTRQLVRYVAEAEESSTTSSGTVTISLPRGDKFLVLNVEFRRNFVRIDLDEKYSPSSAASFVLGRRRFSYDDFISLVEGKDDQDFYD